MINAIGAMEGRVDIQRPAVGVRRPPLWRNLWVVGVALFCGFMFAAAGTAAVPSSALWTGRFVCSDPQHLARQDSGNSYGNTSQSSVSYVCAGGGQPATHVSTPKILGLQLGLGALVAYPVVLGIGWAVRRRRSTGFA